MKIKGLNFEKAYIKYPEQYRVYLNGKQVGFVRMRFGRLTVDYPACLEERLYSKNIDGGFQNNEQRMYYLNKIADIIYKRIAQGL